jgi:hypothetical protein
MDNITEQLLLVIYNENFYCFKLRDQFGMNLEFPKTCR